MIHVPIAGPVPSTLPPCGLCGSTDTDRTYLPQGEGTFDAGLKKGQPCINCRVVCDSHLG